MGRDGRLMRLLLPLLLLATPLAGQDTTIARLERENDSLRQRVWVLTGAVREYILAADKYATDARTAQALLNWYRNRPDSCVDRTRESLHPAGQTWRAATSDTIAQGD